MPITISSGTNYVVIQTGTHQSRGCEAMQTQVIKIVDQLLVKVPGIRETKGGGEVSQLEGAITDFLPSKPPSLSLGALSASRPLTHPPSRSTYIAYLVQSQTRCNCSSGLPLILFEKTNRRPDIGTDSHTHLCTNRISSLLLLGPVPYPSTSSIPSSSTISVFQLLYIAATRSFMF